MSNGSAESEPAPAAQPAEDKPATEVRSKTPASSLRIRLPGGTTVVVGGAAAALVVGLGGLFWWTGSLPSTAASPDPAGAMKRADHQAEVDVWRKKHVKQARRMAKSLEIVLERVELHQAVQTAQWDEVKCATVDKGTPQFGDCRDGEGRIIRPLLSSHPPKKKIDLTAIYEE